MTDLVVRDYGTGPVSVIVLHGGPAAAGDVGPLAKELGKRWRVLEPFQRTRGDRPLTVATHVKDLDDLIRERCGGRHPVLVGHSWGAMLALAYTAAHPSRPASLALVGCGTFSRATRSVLEARIDARLAPEDRTSIANIEKTETDPDRRLAAIGRVMTKVYSHDLIEEADQATAVDSQAHSETWADMIRLQYTGIYPAAFAAIAVPVLMLHGNSDPHPGRLICDELRTCIPQLEYREFPHCGHAPWRERLARFAFFSALGAWVEAHVRHADRRGGQPPLAAAGG